jgi:hypothetical protein
LRCRIVAAIEDKIARRVHAALTMLATKRRCGRTRVDTQRAGGLAAPAAWLLRESVWLAVAAKKAGESPSVMRRSQVGAHE